MSVTQKWEPQEDWLDVELSPLALGVTAAGAGSACERDGVRAS
jgi:hypothetical protein